MIKITFTIFMIMSTAGICRADYELRLNDDVTLIWQQYSVEGNQYCTQKDFGKLCISKRDVVSLKEIRQGTNSGPRIISAQTMTTTKPSIRKNIYEVPAAGQGLTTMNPAEFLRGYDDQERRALLWRSFQVAAQQAKTFAESSDRWIVLKRVVPKKQTALWIDDGTIEIDPTYHPGTLFHEIFHTAFHKSRLHAGKDEAWAEALSDAFRYMMERELPPQEQSDWFLKINTFATMSYGEIMSISGDRGHDQRYGYPASLIVRAAVKDPYEFRKLWFRLLQRREQSGRDVLNDYFSYDIQNGKPY